VAFETGSIFGRLKIDDSVLVKGLRRATGALTGFLTRVKTVGVTVTKFLTLPLRAVALGIKGVVAGFVLLGKVAKVSVGLLTAPFRLLSNFVTRSIFSLKNLVIIFGAALFIRRAKEVETLSTAFDNLTRGVGIVSSSLLVGLRKALRGTVSDLELMRATNQGVLLGVVTSQKEFTRLAEIARRLGRAVGRDAVSALGDLTTGIGRQSRLILDNLGLIVQVAKANEQFARSLGITVEQLTDAQKRQAFMNATLAAAELKLKELGPDILTNADQWDRLGAAIQNTVDTIAGSLVGGSVPKALADFLEDNRQRVFAFTETVSLRVSRFFKTIKEITQQFFRGELNIENLLAELFSFIVSVSVAGVNAVFSSLTLVAIALLKNVFAELRAQFEVEFNQFFTRLNLSAISEGGRLLEFLGLDNIFGDRDRGSEFRKIIKLLGDLQTRFLEVSKAADLSQEEVKNFLGFIDITAGFALSAATKSEIREDARFLQTIREQFLDIDAFVQQLELAGNVEEKNRELADELRRFPETLKREIDKFKDVIKESGKRVEVAAEKSIAEAGDGVSEIATKVTKSLFQKVKGLIQGGLAGLEDTIDLGKLFAIRVADPLAGFRPLIVDRAVQPLANFVNLLERASRIIGSQKGLPFTAEQVVRGRQVIKVLARAVIGLNDIAVAARKAAIKPVLDPKTFEDLFNPLKEEFEKINLEAAAAQIEGDLGGAFERAKAQIKPLLDDLSDLKREEILSLISQNAEDGVLEAAIALDIFAKKLLPVLSLIDDLQKKDLGKLLANQQRAFFSKADAEQVLKNLAEVQQFFDQLEQDVNQINFSNFASRAKLNIGGAFQQVTEDLDGFLSSLSKAQRAKILTIIDENAKNGIVDAAIALEQFRIELELILPLLSEAGKRQIGDLLQKQQEGLGESNALKEADRVAQRLEQRIDRLAVGTADAILGGITEALLRGENVLKNFSEIGANLFRNFMNQAIDDIGKKLGDVLQSIFKSEGAAGFGGALIGIGGLILSNLENKTQTSIDDFGNEITSSEAIRGVVAGPSNVAISKVNQGLKEALSTVEVLLSRIANAVERNQGIATGGGGGGSDNLALQLSGSTGVS